MKSKDKAAQIAYIPQLIEGTDLTVFDTVLLGRLPYYKIYPTKFRNFVHFKALAHGHISFH